MRFVLVTAYALLVTLTSIVSGQAVQHVVDVHVALGGAATGGGGYRENGGLFGRFGVGLSLGPEWGLETDAMLFGRAVSTACVDIAPLQSAATCGNSFPSPIRAVAVDVLRRLPLRGSVSRPVALSAGVGAAFVAPSGQSASARAITADLGAEWTVIHIRRSAVTLAAHGVLIPNLHARALWLVPMTIGFQF